MFILLFHLLFLLTPLTHAAGPPAQPADLGNCTRPGLEINEAAFSTEFANGLQKGVVMYFYRPGCPFCAKFEPTWRCLVDAYHTNTDVVFLKFPVSDYPHIANQYAVEGFPTLRYLPRGYRYQRYAQE